jgi:hypothetical protein
MSVEVAIEKAKSMLACHFSQSSISPNARTLLVNLVRFHPLHVTGQWS